MALARPRPSLLWWLPVLLVIDVATVAALDRRLAWRAEQVARWASPAFREEAGRHRLEVLAGRADLPAGSSSLDKASEPFGRWQGPSAPLGTVRGTVRGREVRIVEWVTMREQLRTEVVAVARLDRAYSPFEVARRPRWRKLRNEPAPRFDDWFEVDGVASGVLGPELQAWMLGDGEGFAYEVAGDLVACRWWHNRLAPGDIGVHLLGVVRFAELIRR